MGRKVCMGDQRLDMDDLAAGEHTSLDLLHDKRRDLAKCRANKQPGLDRNDHCPGSSQ